MSVHNYRKCSKCGLTRNHDSSVTYHRFPNPGKTNTLRALAWAKYCWPNEEWKSVESLRKLSSANKVLCGRHFGSSQFYDTERKKLSKFSVPGSDVKKFLSSLRDQVAKMTADATNSSCPPAHPTTAVLEPDDQKIDEQASTKQTHPDMGRRNDAVTNLIKDSDDQRSMNILQKVSESVSDDQDLDNMDTAACDELFDNENTLTGCDIVTLTGNWDFGFLKETNEITKADTLQNHIKNNETANSDTIFKTEQDNRDSLVPGVDDDDDIVAEIDNDDDDFVMNLMASKINGTDDPGDCEDDDHYVPQLHQGVCCNVCLGNIVGFWYRCCECDDYDMCSDCESRQQHPQHYVLRIPGYRKQSEIRRVMAAVHLSLALPADVKDEPIIKIEDLVEEQPPDPLHTEEIDSSPSTAAASDMKTDDQMTFDPSTSLDPQTTLDPLNSCKLKKPTSKDKPWTLKLIGRKSDIPVMLDALHRRAIVQLKEVMQKSAAKGCTLTPPLLNTAQQTMKQITRKRKLGQKKCVTDFSAYLRNLQDREKTKESIGRKLPIILRAKQLKQNRHNQRDTQPPFSSQSTEKKKDAVLFQNIASDKKDGGSTIQSKEKILKLDPAGDSTVTQNEEKMLKVVLAGGSSILRNTKKVFKVVPTDGSSIAENKEKLFRIVPKDNSSVVQSKGRVSKIYKMAQPIAGSTLLNKEKIFRMVLADDSTVIKNSSKDRST